MGSTEIEDKGDDINKWSKLVLSITYETVSLAIIEDLFTKLDKETYSVVEYKEGSIKRTLIEHSEPSKIYKHIDQVIQSWGLVTDNINLDGRLSFISWKGYMNLRIIFNNIHMFKFGFDNNWLTYHPQTIESIIRDQMLDIAKHTKNIMLRREIQLQEILR
jgi:hypothetical protein